MTNSQLQSHEHKIRFMEVGMTSHQDMVTLYLCAFKEDRGRSSFAAPVTKVVKASNSLELSVHHAQWHFKNDGICQPHAGNLASSVLPWLTRS